MSRQISLRHGWTEVETEAILGWLERNTGPLRMRKMQYCYQTIKNEEFSTNDHITVKRIQTKIETLHNSWKQQNHSRERLEWWVNETRFEEMFPYYARLNRIWGMYTRLNATTIIE